MTQAFPGAFTSQDLGVNSRTEQHASTSTASPQGVGFSNTPAGGVSAVTVTAEGALDEYRFNMFMNDLMAEKKSDIVGFKGVLCVQVRWPARWAVLPWPLFCVRVVRAQGTSFWMPLSSEGPARTAVASRSAQRVTSNLHVTVLRDQPC